jgi:hypothetical protein
MPLSRRSRRQTTTLRLSQQKSRRPVTSYAAWRSNSIGCWLRFAPAWTLPSPPEQLVKSKQRCTSPNQSWRNERVRRPESLRSTSDKSGPRSRRQEDWSACWLTPTGRTAQRFTRPFASNFGTKKKGRPDGTSPCPVDLKEWRGPDLNLRTSGYEPDGSGFTDCPTAFPANARLGPQSLDTRAPRSEDSGRQRLGTVRRLRRQKSRMREVASSPTTTHDRRPSHAPRRPRRGCRYRSRRSSARRN